LSARRRLVPVGDPPPLAEAGLGRQAAGQSSRPVDGPLSRSPSEIGRAARGPPGRRAVYLATRRRPLARYPSAARRVGRPQLTGQRQEQAPAHSIAEEGACYLEGSACQRPPGGAYFASQPKTSWCQYLLLAGFSTQCPSSGKFTIRDGTPRRWRVVNSCNPSA